MWWILCKPSLRTFTSQACCVTSIIFATCIDPPISGYIYFSMCLRQLSSSITSFRYVVLSFIPPPAVLKKANALSFSRSLCSLSDKTAMRLNGEREGLEQRQKWALLERRRRRLGSGWGTIGTQEGDVKGNGSEIKRGFRKTPISRIKTRSNGSEMQVQQSAICFSMYSLDIDVGTHVHILQLTHFLFSPAPSCSATWRGWQKYRWLLTAARPIVNMNRVLRINDVRKIEETIFGTFLSSTISLKTKRMWRGLRSPWLVLRLGCRI